MGHLARNCPERGNFSAYAEGCNEAEEGPYEEEEENIVANLIVVKDLDWCLDSSATNHIEGDEAL